MLMTLSHISPYNQREEKKLAPKQEYKGAKLEETVETRGTR